MRAFTERLRQPAALGAAILLLGGRALAFDYITDASGFFPLAWNPGAVPIQLKLPAPASPLVDGTTYNGSVQTAIDQWNAVLGTIQLTTQIAPASGNTNGNGVNEVVMASSINGSAFSANTLAVALTQRNGSLRTEGDVIFNTAFTWDSYRGARSQFPGRFDIRRIALHELGHVLGLDHPDQGTPPQTLNVIMNSRSGDIDTLQSDDIAG
ncbi:MAG: matrixin family metalloprotease, partial [Opitutae bacterium]|nr:matrixin family metalloprotease [Opitutae bacterium]